MAAAAVTSNMPVSTPFHLPSRQRMGNAKAAMQPPISSSRGQQPSSSSNATTSTQSQPESSPSKPFQRIRSSLEQSLRNATRSKKPSTPAHDEFATVTAKSGKGKEKERAIEDASKEKEKEKSKMLRRIESKVTFRRAGKELATPSATPIPPSPIPPSPVVSKKHRAKDDHPDPVRLAGFTSFVTPSIRQASMSSPALHQALSSPQDSVPAPASSPPPTAVSPSRDRSRRTSLQPSAREISAPAPLQPKRDLRCNGSAVSGSSQPARDPPSRHHRSAKSVPSALPLSHSTASLHPDTPESPETPPGRSREPASPPSTPTPIPGGRGQLARSSSRTAAKSSSFLPLNNSPPSPTTPRAISPIRPRTPTISRPRVMTPSPQRGPSIPRTSPSPTQARRPSFDSSLRPSTTQTNSRGASPTPLRPRPTSPSQRDYVHNRYHDFSTTSLSSPNPECRDLIRTATSMLCKEIVRPPVHITRSESAIRDWEEVEVRTRLLARLERMWGKSGSTSTGSSSNLSSLSGTSPTGFSASGEERERRLFCEALRDGFVLCQLMNKLRSSSVVKPDPKEDGFVRTSNVTKFLAACSSYGLASEELFQRDDLIEATGESLARVAKTIIALISFAESPMANPSKIISGQAKPNSPTSLYGSSRAAAASTPNLSISSAQRPTSPPSPMARRRFSPASPLPPVRSDSPDERSSNSSGGKTQTTRDQFEEDPFSAQPQGLGLNKTTPVLIPPPRSPFRPICSPRRYDDDSSPNAWAPSSANSGRFSTADSTRASVGDYSVRESVADSVSNVRQSVASSAVTDTTAFSSLLEVGRTHSSGYNKFGTIRTVTTEATSEAPSFGRSDGSSMAASLADELARKRGEAGLKHQRDRKLSDVPVVDLTRVAEETEESGSSSKGGRSRDKGKKEPEQVKEPERVEKAPAIRLGKGKWPDDFLDAFQAHNRPIPSKTPTPEPEENSYPSPPLSISPPKKLAIVGATRRNDSVESISQFPRRPTHRPRHSIDTPALLPKESILRRDASPDGASRVVLRRHSTKPGIGQRNGVYLPRSNLDDRGDSGDSLVPFPQTLSVDHGPSSPSPRSSSGEEHPFNEKPRPPRGRFQSDVHVDSAKRRARPSSYDELGAKPARSRFESMVNLGVASSNASASDLISRESMDGSAVRKTLIIREEGKPPTHFQLGNCIGRGQFGSVYRALNLNTGQMVAVKRIRLEGLKEDEVTTLMKEVDLVKSLSHPSIVKYEGMARDEDTLSIVLEYAENGSLGQTLKAFGKLNERLVASYVVKILEGLHYLHSSGVVHCDLKAANILTTKTGNVKLSDFGVSLNMRAMERDAKDVAGTPNWMAPEVIELKGASPKSDIWSLACTVIELFTGRPPYADMANSMSVMFRIVEDGMPPIPEGCSSLLQDFLTLCLNKDPAKRPSAEELFEHGWLKQYWAGFKELRPQDSIPFLRRVSADLQKSEAIRYLSQIDMSEVSPTGNSPLPDEPVSASPITSPISIVNRKSSNSSVRPLTTDSEISPREHTFVKTAFSKPMVCRVCLQNTKKNAVLCAQCSLVAHSKCAPNAPPTCDLRAQLLLYAQYAEKGNPASVYSNPAELLNDVFPTSPASDVSYVARSPRTSLDTVPPPITPTQPHPPTPHPPTAFKLMAAAFKRSRTTLTPEPGQPSSSSSPPVQRDDRLARSRTGLSRKEDRPQSLSSNSTHANTSSLRSAATAAESFSSRNELGQKSVISSEGVEDTETRASASRLSAAGEPAVPRTSKMALFPGTLNPVPVHLRPHTANIPVDHPETRRHKKHLRDTKSASGNCIVQ